MTLKVEIGGEVQAWYKHLPCPPRWYRREKKGNAWAVGDWAVGIGILTEDEVMDQYQRFADRKRAELRRQRA